MHSIFHSIKKCYQLSVLVYLSLFSSELLAESVSDECILSTIKTAKKALTYDDIKKICSMEEVTPPHMKKGRIANRIISEKRTAFDPYVITPHKMNYILPVSYTNNINKDVYDTVNDWGDSLINTEAKFQLSIKVPLNTQKIFTRDDGIFFGFTMQSWWQVYSDGISKPFRETNYQPEVFYLSPLRYHPFDGNTAIVVGLEHQSNGRAQGLSRSWNRTYINFLFEKDNFALSFQPWWRIPESDKEFDLDPKGDDNPDISDYMGYFQLATVYKWEEYEFSFKGHENFKTHNGGMELGLTFPLWGKLRGYIQYTNGYGESLIDYNHSQQRLGIGFALTDVL
ncbi:phospholipase A [Pseudocolwellia agarivorans]|uniref:phospholipase A n=1 Tax=Pseudocolwellia agarivorans TaxID=1911682 RepID=UPI00098620AE|nr:phospholipase A [Pseudocolwellia agarivorans]